MNRVRMIVEVVLGDYEAAVEVLGRAAMHVEQNLPDVLAWDVFADEDREHMIWYEEFADEHALLEYEKEMTDLGYRNEARKYLELERIVVLGPVSDPELLNVLEDVGAEYMSHAVGTEH